MELILASRNKKKIREVEAILAGHFPGVHILSLDDIGFSKDSYCIQAPGGHSFGDSGVMCTPRDLLLFARLMMNEGSYDGVQYLDRAYCREATKKQLDNN